MKRLYILLTLLLTMVLNLEAQVNDYKPFVEEGKRWVWHTDSYRTISNYFSFLIEGDSVINGKSYKKVWYSNTNNPTKLYGFVREEDSRVYLFPEDDYMEHILYDFSDPTKSEYHGTETFTPITRQDRPGFKIELPKFWYDQFMIIEGIGFDSECAGTTFWPICGYYTGDYYNYLDYVEDAQGDIVYYGLGYIQPLVREGVVWHYAYQMFSQDLSMEESNKVEIVDHKVEFRGDTVINGQTYKKCYLYQTEKLNPSTTAPVAFMQETGGYVKVIYGGNTKRYATTPYAYDKTEGEKVIYDFYNFDRLMRDALPEEYTETAALELTTVEEVQLGDLPVPVHKYQFKDYIDVEGVGADAQLSGYLFDPYPEQPTGFSSMILGLIKLEDSDGNVLYKGKYYNKYINFLIGQSDLTGDGKVDMADINVAVSAVLGVGDNDRADVNGDGTIDIADLNTILNAILHAEPRDIDPLYR